MNQIDTGAALNSYRDSFAVVRSAAEDVAVSPTEITATLRTNEQEAYAVVTHKLLTEHQPDLAKTFAESLKEAIKKFRANHNGETDLFKIADRLMRKFVRTGELAHADYREFKLTAFGKCQFDSDRTWLDSTKRTSGASNDTPVREIGTALEKFAENSGLSEAEFQAFRAREAILSREAWETKKTAGTLGVRKAKLQPTSAQSVAAPASSATQASAESSGAPAGFLWKPQSDSDGKLVVLLPNTLTGRAIGVAIYDSRGETKLAEGRYGGVGNGERQHYRFDRSGANFPDGAIVMVAMRDGSTINIAVPETSARVEGG